MLIVVQYEDMHSVHVLQTSSEIQKLNVQNHLPEVVYVIPVELVLDVGISMTVATSAHVLQIAQGIHIGNVSVEQQKLVLTNLVAHMHNVVLIKMERRNVIVRLNSRMEIPI